MTLALLAVPLGGSRTAEAAEPIVVTTTAPTGPGSITDAFAVANSSPGSDTIVLQRDATYDLDCSHAPLSNANGALDIVGNDATISLGCGAERLIDHTSAEVLAASDLTVSNWANDWEEVVAGCGGVIMAEGPLVVDQVNVFHGRTDGSGGSLCSNTSIEMVGGGTVEGWGMGDDSSIWSPSVSVDRAHPRGLIVAETVEASGSYVGAVQAGHATIDNSTIEGSLELGAGTVRRSTLANYHSKVVAVGGEVELAGNVLDSEFESNCETRDGGTFASGGFNFDDDSSCGLSAPGDEVADPELQIEAWHDPAPPAAPAISFTDYELFAEGKIRARKPTRTSNILEHIPANHPLCSGVDQIGFPRPAGEGCEPGAVEYRNIGSVFEGVQPQRVLDTRTFMVPNGHTPGAKVVGGSTLRTRVAGIANVPADATAVVVNVTSTESTSASGFVTAYPTGGGRPLASTLNLQPGANVANLATVQVGPDGHINLYTNVGATHLVLDVFGYYQDSAIVGNGYQSLNDWRLLDTRTATVPPGWPIGSALSTGSTLQLTIPKPWPFEESTVAVALNVTAAGATSDLAYLTVWPDGTPKPPTSNVNVQKGVNVANLVVLKVGTGGRINIATNTGSTHVIVDAAGYFSPTAPMTYVPLTPTRMFDSRSDVSFGPDEGRSLSLFYEEGLTETTAIVANLTATETTSREGYARAVNPYTWRPSTSTLNYRPGVNVSNHIMAGAEYGELLLYNSAGRAHLVLDVVGVFRP